ncbi:MAG: hypothetical protein DRJ10_03010 [Bacteroidetes bacterium]|nr:MAG: hypothetical protein DRJ10_03010 [Bacteroidota bacterium]RLD86189.1 MAG: hypothetical protein DRJ07_01395 [Bacteroidota bacterium]
MDTIYKKVYNNLPLRSEKYDINSRKFKNELFSIDYFFKHKKERTILNIKSELIEKDNYQISINDKKLILVLSEKKEISRPIYSHHLEKSLLEATTYERLRNIEIPLSERNYYVRNTHVDLNSHILIIVLGRISIINNNSKGTIIKYI